jgi:NMD protein affecting ribosome stability and mRNA decay
VTVVASALGTRIDCDRCGAHVGDQHEALVHLRDATGFARRNAVDLCPRCAESQPAPSPSDFLAATIHRPRL